LEKAESLADDVTGSKKLVVVAIHLGCYATLEEYSRLVLMARMADHLNDFARSCQLLLMRTVSSAVALALGLHQTVARSFAGSFAECSTGRSSQMAQNHFDWEVMLQVLLNHFLELRYLNHVFLSGSSFYLAVFRSNCLSLAQIGLMRAVDLQFCNFSDCASAGGPYRHRSACSAARNFWTQRSSVGDSSSWCSSFLSLCRMRPSCQSCCILHAENLPKFQPRFPSIIKISSMCFCSNVVHLTFDRTTGEADRLHFQRFRARDWSRCGCLHCCFQRGHPVN